MSVWIYYVYVIYACVYIKQIKLLFNQSLFICKLKAIAVYK